MGAVYEGENTRIARKVAIKVLRAEAARSPELAARFQREARAAARIGSGHVCDVLDLGDLPNGDAFLVMEFLDGEDLQARLKFCGKIPARDLAIMAFQALDGLGTMHDAGIIHRDLKPANLFLTRTPRGDSVKIRDFGVSKFSADSAEPSHMTATGMVMGTVHYMSPEQARGLKDIDGRSDLYALGVILYKALTSKLPFQGSNFNELLFKIALETPTPVEELEPSVPAAFAAIVRKAMHREPELRYQSAAEFQEAVRAWGVTQGLTFETTAPSKPLPSVPPPSVGPDGANELDSAQFDLVHSTARAWAGSQPGPLHSESSVPAAAISDTALVGIAEQEPPAPAPPASLAPPRRKSSAPTVVGALMVVVGAAAAAVFFYAGKGAGPSVSAASKLAAEVPSAVAAPTPAAPPATSAQEPAAVMEIGNTGASPAAARPGADAGIAAAKPSAMAPGKPSAASAESPSAAETEPKPAREWGAIPPTVPTVEKPSTPALVE
jgi:serine/threonine-protein kinase